MKARIVCAANRYEFKDQKDLLLIGARHWDKHMRSQADNYGYLTGRSVHDGSIETQGFIDQYGAFYTREDAWNIALKNGQIIRSVSSNGTLYSENLY